MGKVNERDLQWDRLAWSQVTDSEAQKQQHVTDVSGKSREGLAQGTSGLRACPGHSPS